MPTRTLSTLVAVFNTDAEARAAADDLRSYGVPSSDIFVTAGNSSTTAHEYHQHEGGIKGWFHSLFGEEHQDQNISRYEDAVNTGNVFLSVETSDANTDAIADILNRHSPLDVHRDTASGNAQRNTAPPAETINTAPTRTAGSTATTKEDAIPVIQEELRVGKRAILRGGVRVYSRVREQPVEETIGLREERVVVDRTPVNRDLNNTDLRSGEERVIEVKEFAEEPVITKTARVVEEVRVRKEATERKETIRDTVRSTEVEVEDLSRATSSNVPVAAHDYDASYRNPSGTNDYSADFRRDFNQNYATTGESYDTYAPAYEYGYAAANDSRYQGRNFDEVESDLRNDYARRYPNSTWERMKASVRYGWDRLTHHNRY